MGIHEREQQENGGKAGGVKTHQDRSLVHADRSCHFTARQFRKYEGEDEFQWIDIEQDEEQQHHIQKYGVGIFQPVTARKHVVGSPDHYQLREADGKGKEAPKTFDQGRVTMRNFQGYNKQSQGKSKNHVAKRFEPRDFAGSPPEVFFGEQSSPVL